jgi:hypothetical protein
MQARTALHHGRIIIGVAFSVEESAIGTTITTIRTTNKSNITSSLVAESANSPVPFVEKVVATTVQWRFLPLVPIGITDSSTTSAFAKAQSVDPAGRLDKITRRQTMNQNHLGIVWIPTTSSRSASHKPRSGFCRSAGVLAKNAQ